MTSGKAWVERSKVLLKEGGAQGLKMRLQNFLIKSRECFARANIYNQSKLLHDNF